MTLFFYFWIAIDAEEIKQTIKWRGLDLEQLEHTMLGDWFHIRVNDGRTGLPL